MKTRLFVLAFGCCLLLMTGCWDREVKFHPPKSSYQVKPIEVTSSGRAIKANAAIITSAFFATPVTSGGRRYAGLPPVMGRQFRPEDYLTNANVALLSGRFWKNQFNGDPDVLGKAIQINAKPYTVVGVMASTFDVPSGVDLWTPTKDLK
ncbi:MAG TPA: ABC transporter permease [Blastocatellia bacterium]|nr:ABC transporter permease [Blastocatellia bacterium]